MLKVDPEELKIKKNIQYHKVVQSKFNYLYTSIKYYLFNKFNILTFLIGIILGFSITKPKEYYLYEKINFLLYQTKSKNEEISKLIIKLNDQIRINEISIDHNKSLTKE